MFLLRPVVRVGGIGQLRCCFGVRAASFYLGTPSASVTRISKTERRDLASRARPGTHHRREEVVERALHPRFAVSNHHGRLPEHLVLLLDVVRVPAFGFHGFELLRLRLHLLLVHGELLPDAGHDAGLDWDSHTASSDDAEYDSNSRTDKTGLTASGSSSTTQTGTNANLPPYYALAFIIKT